MIERPRLRAPDGTTLEAKVDIPDDAERVTVLCHPHPLQGGSMNAPLMIAMTRNLTSHGHIVVRFNFRGTGDSTGEHDYGTAEVGDVSAAVEHARTYQLPLSLGGWSFGAGVALRWLADSADGAIPYSGIAPAPDLLPDELPAGPKRVVVGSRDQVIDVDRLRQYALDHGIDLVITSGDHFFHGRGERVAELVRQGLEA